MPLPTSYTEKSLAEFMHTSLGKVGEALNLHFSPDGPGDYAESVNDTLILYGSENLPAITGLESIKKLRALARVAVWKFVVANFAAYYTHSSDGSSYNRGELFKNAEAALKIAEFDASPYITAYSVRIVPVDNKQDPYSYRPAEENSSD